MKRQSVVQSQSQFVWTKLVKHSVVLFAAFSITTFGIVAAQESPASTSSNVVQGTREIYVSPQGDNKNDGSASNPVASLQIA
jgi:hypothetical protein